MLPCQIVRSDSPLLAVDSAADIPPGSVALQYSVLVYGLTQKNLSWALPDKPEPNAFLVPFQRNCPIIVFVKSWTTVESVEADAPMKP